MWNQGCEVGKLSAVDGDVIDRRDGGEVEDIADDVEPAGVVVGNAEGLDGIAFGISSGG